MTPKKFYALIICAADYNKHRNADKAEHAVEDGYIDTMQGW